MPPQRTVPPAKAMKTERTHEENQERAYIAASRRSDRSLEARVESARRASVIHKRRTGRSLRVTEQDVINEEMYEEEDDDLPLHYRRLTAHLQTGSPDFNRRLAAYLTNHVAMRSALDQAITTSYAQQYPNAPQFAHNRTMYTSPMHAPGLVSPSSPSSIHRQAPYPSPGSLNYRNGAHGRSQSIATPQEITSPADMPAHNRRMSMPQGSFPMPQPAMMASHGLPTFGDANLGQDFSPFSTALPPESQLLLGPSLDQNDSLTSMLMAGSESLSQPSSQPNKLPQDQQSMNIQRQGLSSTLAPSVLDDLAAPGRNEDGDGSINPELTFNLSAENQKIPSSSQDSNDPLGIETDWNAFINDNSWEHNAT